MFKKKILLKGCQALQETKVIKIDGEEYTLNYPTAEEWLKVKVAMFAGSAMKYSMTEWKEKKVKAIVEEKVDIYNLAEEDLETLIEEIDNFIEEVDEDELELNLQAVNTRWKNLARDKYIVNGQPNYVGYVRSALSTVSTDGIEITDLTAKQAEDFKAEVDQFFREYKPNPKRIGKETAKAKSET